MSTTLNHLPACPPRKETVGEGIYLKLWIEFATKHPEEWLRIFDLSGQVDQRAATVAASFMVFMGCNGGMSFTFMAERYSESRCFYSIDAAYLAAWAVNNRRVHHVNHGLRTSEFVLAEQYPINHDEILRPPVKWSCVPDISQADNDVLECMAIWWSTRRAKDMRRTAEPMIKEADKAMLRGFRQRIEVAAA